MNRFAAAFSFLCALSSCESGGSTDPLGSPNVPPGKYASAPAQVLDATRNYTATIVSSKGIIEVALDANAAPITVNNFVFLARERYYDGLTFHRVVDGFVIQGGDPKGNGSGGPGYTIVDEPSGLLHGEGVVAMAKSSAPNSAGSQFYVTLAPQPALDGKYTVFGKVTAGMDVVRTITVGDAINTVTVSELPKAR